MDTNQRKIGVILSYITLIINALVAFIYVPILLRSMGNSEYGLYQLMGSLIAYFVILDFGLPSTIIRYYSKYKATNNQESMENVLALCSRIYVVITAAVLVIGIILYFFLDSFFPNMTPLEMISAKQIYIVLLINIAVTLPTQIFNAIITSHERFIFLKTLSIVQAVLQPIVIISLMMVSPTALTVVIVQTIFNIIVVAIRIYYCFGKLHVKIKMHYFDKGLFGSIMRYSFFIFLNVIIDQLFWRSNQLILGAVATTAAVAVYSVAFQIAYNYMTLSNVVSGVFLPRVTSMVANDASNQELSDLFTKVGRLQFLVLSCVVTGFILFGKQFIAIWAGTGFDDTYLITLFLIVPFTVELIQNIGLIILQAQNKFAFRVCVFLVIAIANVLIAIPAAQKFGGIGCAATTGITFFIGNALIMNLFYAKKIGLHIKEFWIQITKITIPAVICCILGSFLQFLIVPNDVLDLIVKILIYLLFFFTVMWFFTMNAYEKDLIKGPIGKIKKCFSKS